jgi:hypothetical protein
MIYFEVETDSISTNMLSILILLLFIMINMLVCPKRKTKLFQQYSAKPTYLRYIKYDPETGNVKYTN